jgi:hypothetical protein
MLRCSPPEQGSVMTLIILIVLLVLVFGGG